MFMQAGSGPSIGELIYTAQQLESELVHLNQRTKEKMTTTPKNLKLACRVWTLHVIDVVINDSGNKSKDTSEH